MSIQWKIKPGTELQGAELYDLLQLRVDIFVVEQKCPYPELDGNDILPNVYHVQAFMPGDFKVAAYLRVMYNGKDPTQARIGRVVVRDKYRSTGLGRKIMNKAQETIDEFQKTYPVKSVILDGQAHLEKWYRSFGYVPTTGVPYLEDGIPHVTMVKQLP